MPFPSGESRAEFAARCVRAFDELLEQNFQEDCTLIAHGGMIMAIMERFVQPHGSYYDFQVSNGGGFALNTNGSYHELP